jgi:hypothetical protein
MPLNLHLVGDLLLSNGYIERDSQMATAYGGQIWQNYFSAGYAAFRPT